MDAAVRISRCITGAGRGPIGTHWYPGIALRICNRLGCRCASDCRKDVVCYRVASEGDGIRRAAGETLRHALDVSVTGSSRRVRIDNRLLHRLR